WFAHGIAVGSFPAVQYGTVGTNGSSISVATAFHSSTSDDFNPSIGVFPVSSGQDFVYLNWAYTDTPNGVATTDTFSGLSPGDAVQSLVAVDHSTIVGSSTGDTRFGDFSSVSITPYALGACPAGRTAIIAQEYFKADGSWATRLANVGFC